MTWAGNSGSERKVLYLTAEKFMYGFVSALRTQTALAFKEALRGIDVQPILYPGGRERAVRLRVSANALKTVDHRGGFDAFLLKAKDTELSPRVLELKRQVVKKRKATAA